MVSVKSTMLPLDTEAPDFTLPDPAGRNLSLAEAAGARGTLVAFVCNHCPYVKHLAVDFGAAAARWTAAGVVVIGINSNDADAYPNDRPDKMAEQAAEWNWRFPYLVDADQSVAHAYRAACTPDFFLFDADRRLVYRGRFDESTPGNGKPITGAELDAAVAALVAGEPLPDEQVPSIGCNIKWKAGNQPPWFG